MASKVQKESSAADAEDLLETVDKNLDRVKVLYEQYFLGIQKQAPAHLHNEIERRLRDLAQMQLRSTRLRYRLATIQQKFGSYNAYWRRTLRQIENGTYARTLQKIGREAARTGVEVPEEILAAMPKRMREQVQRDRDLALAAASRRQGGGFGDAEGPRSQDEGVAVIREPKDLRHGLKTRTGAHVLDESDSDIDIDSFFQGVEADVPEVPRSQPPPPATSAPVSRGRVPPSASPLAASQAVRPNPIVPGAAAARGPVHVEALTDPFLRAPTQIGRAETRNLPAAPPPASGGRPSVAPPPGPGRPRPSVPQPPMVPGGTRQSVVPPMVPGGTRQSVVPPMVPGGTRQSVVPPMVPRNIAPSRAPAGDRAGSVPTRTMAPSMPTQTRAPIRPPARTEVSANTSARQASPQRPPPGMTDADVNALYAKYIKAKQMVGDKIAPGEHNKLLKTINSQAPKIMQQYNASAVDFSVVVKDNQVILRAKPKLKP